jgi:hypothetical protein
VEAGAAVGIVDEALERFHATADEYHGGLSNHGPMAVDALARLGAVDEIEPWARGYEGRLKPFEGPPPTVDLDEPWEAVVRREVPSLLRGAVAAAGHGAIRVGHAVSMLRVADTPPRRMELARALAYWRASYDEVTPGPPIDGVSSARSALGAVASLAPPPPGPGLISDRVRSLGPVPVFEAATVDDVIDAAAGALLASRRSSTIALVHAVTTPAALAVLAPYVAVGAVDRASWLVAAALVAGYADALDPPAEVGDDVSSDEAVGRAVETGDEHAIKLAAVCVGRPAPVHVAVTAAVAGRLGRRR